MFGLRIPSWLRPETFIETSLNLLTDLVIGPLEGGKMSEQFPFNLDDVKGWLIKRKDGTVVKYNLISREESSKLVKSSSTPIVNYPRTYNTGYTSMSRYCEHTPSTKNPPIFTNGKISLWIADCVGARKAQDEFDVCIDGGNVLDLPRQYELPDLYGDPGLSKSLAPHGINFKRDGDIAKEGPKILKIRWSDRCPPPLVPAFWPALLEDLNKLQAKKKDGSPLKVLTICQGGHGRSGSALVALVMCMTDYTPLDALTHIRALHCARAIESKDQHLYLNLVARLLGRTENALEAEQVKSFKERFLTMDVADTYKDRVKGGSGAQVEVRDEGYL